MYYNKNHILYHKFDIKKTPSFNILNVLEYEYYE